MRVVIRRGSQALLRQGVVRLLEDAGFEVVAEAGDAPDLLRKVGAHKPDVAIVDVQMPPDNTDDGLWAALEVRARHPMSACSCSPSTPTSATPSIYRRHRRRRRLPAEGPGVGLRGFADAVRRVVTGSSIDPTVVSRIMGRRRRDDPLDALTGRERDVLELMAQGRSNGGIAESSSSPRRRGRARHRRSSPSSASARRPRPSPRPRGTRLHARLGGQRDPRAHHGPPAARLRVRCPVQRADPSPRPSRPLPAAASAPPTPSSRTSTTASPFSRRTATDA